MQAVDNGSGIDPLADFEEMDRPIQKQGTRSKKWHNDNALPNPNDSKPGTGQTDHTGGTRGTASNEKAPLPWVLSKDGRSQASSFPYANYQSQNIQHVQGIRRPGEHHEEQDGEGELPTLENQDSYECLEDQEPAANEPQFMEENGVPMDELDDRQCYVNLELIIKQEGLLWGILEALRADESAAYMCDEWINTVNSNNLIFIDRLFKDDEFRKHLRISIILEIMSILSTIYFTDLRPNLRPQAGNQLKSLMFYIHQNFLITMSFIIARISPSSMQSMGSIQTGSRASLGASQTQMGTNNFNTSNVLKANDTTTNENKWVTTMRTIITTKSLKPLKRSEKINQLKSNNNMAQDIIRAMSARNKIPSPLKKFTPKTPQTGAEILYKQAQLLPKLANMAVPKAKEQLFEALEVTINNLRTQLPGVVNKLNSDKMAANDAVYEMLGMAGQIDPPYLPEKSVDASEYTLVLDLDETLVHYYENDDEGGNFRIRPFALQFLKEMSDLYEVVIFTAAAQDYADWVLDSIDPDGLITHRLYRQHCTPRGTVFTKDLTRIGRDLSKCLIIDNVAENFQIHPDNGIFILSWFDDMEDTVLEEMAPLLKELVRAKVKDVRVALKRYRDQMLRQLAAGVTNPHLNIKRCSPTP